MRRTYSLLGLTKKAAYQDLLEAAGTRCEAFSFVIRDEPLDAACQAVVDALGPYLKSRTRTSKWPGTILHSGEVTLCCYRLTQESSRILLGAASVLDDWRHPALPEDLSFWREDGSTWFVLISHEHDAYFELTLEERESLASSYNSLTLAKDELT